MTPRVTITISPEAQNLLMRMGNTPAMMTALRKQLIVEMEGDDGVRTNVVEKHLTGRGPFPPDQHRLGVRTSRLRNSVYCSYGFAPDSVDARIGSNVKYAAIHEYGGTIKRVMLAGSVRLLTDAKGNLQIGKTGGAIFARKNKRPQKRFLNVPYAGGKRVEVVIPERAPFRTGVNEMLPKIGRGMSKAIVDYFAGNAT